MQQIDMFTQDGANLIIKEEKLDKAIDILFKKGVVKYMGDILYYARPRYRMVAYLYRYSIGEGHPTPSWQLSQYMFNITTADEKIRQYIRKLRREGYPIGSSPSGYYIATTTEELVKGMDFMLTKTLDEVRTLIMVYPPFKQTIHAVTGYAYEHADRSQHGQGTIDFEALTALYDKFVERYSKQEDMYDFQTYDLLKKEETKE